MREFITSADLENLARSGTTQLVLRPGVVLTEAARETAARVGVRIVDSPAGAPAAESWSKPGGPPAWPRGSLMDESVVAAWREEFPILADAIHVGNCSQGPQSRHVRRAIEAYLDNWLTVGMDWDYWMAEVSRAKAEFARLIGASPDEIAVSTSVSEAVSSVASALRTANGRRKVVATEAEFPTVGHVWLAHQKYGYKVEFVPVRDGQLMLDDYDRYVDQDTLVASITHVYYLNGFKQDLEPVVRLAHSRGSLVLVDAYQSLGTCPLDVKALDIDFLASGNLKYLLGIPGIAFLYVKRDLVPGLTPAVTGWFGQENPFSFEVRLLDYARDARRFDTGTPPVMPAFAARAGMEIVNHLGPKAISDRVDMLSRVALDACRRHGLKSVSPEDISRKGPTTAIDVPGGDSHAVEVALRARNIIASARGPVIRVAPHFFIRPEDIERVVGEIALILRR
ncbi:MAG: aminotransferase class V-fold PLP-dependent enzyme [Bacillota bacterium]|nr:MAG: aminotransferase class V-fold PLP-dependent enzyme [Bacillota bacterium]